MNIVRVQVRDGSIHYGCEVANEVFQLEGGLEHGFSQGDVLLDPVRRLAPVVPTAIYAIGLNYREHAAEMNSELPEYPVVFMKSTASVLDPDCPIELPRHLHSDQVDYECELAVVIGKRCKNVSAKDALDYVLGYTCSNDVSARDWQKKLGGGQWMKGKSFDTFCPLGPVLVTADQIPNPQILPIRTILNGEIRQESYTGDMIFTVAELIAFLSGSTTLLPGTVILTGTPPGVGVAATPQRFLKPGDDVAIEISGIGRLRNPVVAEA
ncbi:fumarylacetoacetate hydrolase family protein [Coraliomargarita sp. SDUM461003]|uniref:Fumarylacetoacetate hydrolase family protein n=1 Tax=Thalassobacterium maritimum TaxID=3041265 RepID=A0ABU1AXU4_9BACT|nr:fumarylacetoacetate hydrolase family protein [Coraliomargarita sp. SDUM461003]MDQ8208923.1 fumarylacetoacetate hydrolase family protein [Coraliomargarita sp. SDUM461003]